MQIILSLVDQRYCVNDTPLAIKPANLMCYDFIAAFGLSVSYTMINTLMAN